MSKGNVVIGVLAGVAVGALIGILFAPDKGSETRRKISKKSSDTIDELKENFDKLLNNTSDKLETIKEEAVDLYEKGKRQMS